MRVLRRVPGWVWGASATTVIIGALLAYSAFTKDQAPRTSPETPATASVEASADPADLRQTKLDLDKDIRTYVRAFLSRKPTMTKSDYIDRMRPLELADHLGYFEQYIATTIEQDLMERGVTIKVVMSGEVEGELHGDAGKRRFEGIVPLKLVMVEEDVRSILMPPTSFHLQMTEGPERWQANYFAPVT